MREIEGSEKYGRVAHASRVPVSASRRNRLSFVAGNNVNVEFKLKVRDRGTRSPARETRALPFFHLTKFQVHREH